MTINNELFEELCTGHVLGALSNEEEITFTQLLDEASADQHDFLRDMEAVASEIAVLVTPEAPSTQIKQNILAAAEPTADKTKEPAKIHSISKFRYAVAASFLFILVSIGLLFYSQNLQNDLNKQSTLISEQNTTIRELETEVERRDELLTILEAREVDLILMDGLDVNPSGYGKVVWDKDNGQALLQVANLPAVPLNKDYQLWFVVNNEPISAGVFAVNNPQQDNFFKIEQFQNQAASGAFAITLEPEGGSPQPTGDMYMIGNTSTN